MLNASSSGCSAAPSSGESATAASPELDFSRLPNVLCLAPGAVLSLRNVRLVDIAHADRWAPAPAQPLRNAGVGFPLWPTLTLQAGASVRHGRRPGPVGWQLEQLRRACSTQAHHWGPT